MKTIRTITALLVAVLAMGFLAAFYANTASAAIGDVHTLTVNVDGTGCSVTQNVTQETYVYGDVIELTPVAADGWEFSEWSGDLTGSDSPAMVVMDANKTITATFTQIDDSTPTPTPSPTPSPTPVPTHKPTATPKPTASPTPAPTSTPKPTTQPTTIPIVHQDSMSAYLLVFGAAIILAALLIGMVKRKNKRPYH